MELIYLWINKSSHDCIKNQEFNFSPIHRFKVDNKNNPQTITYEKSENEINLMNNGNISNITAIVGSNGTGKSTLLSFIANNSCFNRNKKDGSNKAYYDWEYEHNKSIYIFKNEEDFIVYHNLENEVKCDPIVKKINIIQNEDRMNYSQGLWNFRHQMIVYLSNCYYVPKEMSNYSQGHSVYNVNLHLQSLNMISNRFYNHLINVEQFFSVTSEIIKYFRDEKTFQELLDVLYYAFLTNNTYDAFVGNFKNEVYISFDDIRKMGNKFFDEITIERSNSELKKEQEKFNNKLCGFLNFYNEGKINDLQNENLTIALYFNLLFEIFFNDDNFILPELNFEEDIYLQLENTFKKYPQYLEYLKDIKEADDILSKCENYQNIIENPDGFACQYQKVIGIDNNKFYRYFEEIFKKRKSYVLKYIRIKNLEMSSGERAMQNMFSWLALTAQIDDILSIKREGYTSKLLLIDEIDLYSHPKWQRKIIAQLIDTINQIEKVPVQIIITSHSPIILSDFPNQNIIYLSNNEETEISNNNEHKQSFGANIYTLFNDVFFLKDGVIGEFAKKMILNIYNEIKPDGKPVKEEKYYKNFIDMLGDNILKKEMQRLFNKKFGG